MSVVVYIVLVLATGVERLIELVISKRNAAHAFAQGGVEHGQRHFPFMVVLHTGLLLACIAEVVLLDRPFIGALGWPMLVIALLCQAGRYWVWRVAPPLTITHGEIDRSLEIIEAAIRTVAGG